jgi:molybdate transport system ATP-binding protein
VITIDVRKRLGTFALNVAFDADHETVVLFGHSGSGKSVTLATVAGLMRPDAGTVSVGGRTVFDAAQRVDLPPQQRNVGYVVQQIALFPHLTARQNIEYGLTGWTRDARARRVAELTALLSIEGLESRMPHQLSGGQQQRVALARALARPVDALLLDEPFSALDEALRADLRTELLRLRRELAVPVVFVTHDLREAYLLADRIAVLDDGRVLQFASREHVFGRPASRRVAELTGVRNIFAGEADSDGRVLVAGVSFRVETEHVMRGPVDLAIRSERCILRRIDPDEELPENCFVADIVEDLAFGNAHTLRLEPLGPGPAIEVEVASRPYEVLRVASQRRWVVELAPPDLHVMTRDGAA